MYKNFAVRIYLSVIGWSLKSNSNFSHCLIKQILRKSLVKLGVFGDHLVDIFVNVFCVGNLRMYNTKNILKNHLSHFRGWKLEPCFWLINYTSTSSLVVGSSSRLLITGTRKVSNFVFLLLKSIAPFVNSLTNYRAQILIFRSRLPVYA